MPRLPASAAWAMNTEHAAARIAERLAPGEAFTLARAIETLAQSPYMRADKSYAVMVARVETPRGTFTIHPDGTGPSNGTDLYAIIRNRTIVTVMWRRQAQPVTPDAFRVDVVGKVALVR